MKEIVGAMIGTFITNNPLDIAEAVQAGTITEWMDRRRMQFMASMDLGHNWDLMASGPTLFCIDDDGHAQAPDAAVEMEIEQRRLG